ncbi:hypothetical protein BUALT_Bualt14G0127200 [Buddleja alternifolia]|uniref:Uncharacterized protein n=1 Tax=Buddleja alternifolia TaxID=168488 RepID=A0AAV6WJ46_9LAMI|nr:hypothetical protein BUALT_Bualt14G0127200 [Buddleja alternifolia]
MAAARHLSLRRTRMLWLAVVARRSCRYSDSPQLHYLFNLEHNWAALGYDCLSVLVYLDYCWADSYTQKFQASKVVRFFWMKRVIEIVEGESEDLGLKKVRLFNGNDENSGALKRNEGVGEGFFVDNKWSDSSQVKKTEDFFGNVVSDNLAGPSVGEMKLSNEWDLDNINFDTFFSNEEQRKKFDMNVPVCRTVNSYLEHTQGPVINNNRKEIIEIELDDSGDEVEIIGVTTGYQDKGKQIELVMPYDRNGLGDLNLGLGMFGMDNINSESSLVAGGERRYTREEKGKANGVEGDNDGNAKHSKKENINNKADEEAKGGPNDENERQKANQNPLEPPKDYIHVIARRGQATDSHSLDKSVIREKISERMELLPDIVPGCNKGMEALTEVKVSTRSRAMVIMVEPFVKEFHKKRDENIIQCFFRAERQTTSPVFRNVASGRKLSTLKLSRFCPGDHFLRGARLVLEFHGSGENDGGIGKGLRFTGILD